MKTTKEIAADCGIDGSWLLENALEYASPERNFTTSTQLENELCELVGALYRRIEKMEDSEMWINEFLKFRRAVRQALFECGVMSNPGSFDDELTAAIVQLGKDKKALLENCVIMQSRVAAILAVPDAVDALQADNIFGINYGTLLSADDRELRAAILQAGGQLADSTHEKEGDNR